MGPTVNISVTTHCKHLCKYPLVYLDGKSWVEINKRKNIKKKTRYPFYRRLDGPQDRSERVRKISPLPGFDPRTVQPVATYLTQFE